MRIIPPRTPRRLRLNKLNKGTDEMIKNKILAALVAVGLGAGAGAVQAAEGGHVEDFAFSFEGPFGKYDPQQLQRGLQVYQEVCSACHGLKQVAYRTLGDPGGPQLVPAQVKAFAALHDITNPETGDDRPAKPSDYFAANTSVGAPDLSLMAKARAGFHGPMGLGINQLLKGMGGPEYIASILTGFTGKEKEKAGITFYQNKTFPGGWISMPPPLEDGQVEFSDGSPNSVRYMAQDVAAFLMWTAEPKMMARKRTGFLVISFLILLTSLLYLSNKKLWAGPKHKV